MKKIASVAILAFFCAVTVFSQSAEKLEEIAKSDLMTVGQACYLAGCFTEQVKDNASYDDAFEVFKPLKMFTDVKSTDFIRIDMFANLALQVTEIDAGLWYRLSKSPHYAFRALKRMGVVGQKMMPSKELSGQELLNIFYQLVEQTSEVKDEN